MSIRICVYNVEWFDKWFNPDNTLKTDPETRQKAEAWGRIVKAINPDLIGIVEGPNTTNAGKSSTVCLEVLAADQNIRPASATMGFASRGSQELCALFDPAKLAVTHSPAGRSGAKANPPFDENFFADSDMDGINEYYRHYRPPFEMQLTRADGGDPMIIILAHMKSKGIFSNNDYIHWQRESKRNRRKLFAEANHVRLRADELLDDGKNVVVMGDINDGPGMDQHEMMFGRSAVEIVMGSLFQPSRILHAHSGAPKWGQYGWSPSSARFNDPFTHDPVNVLIDHILASEGIQTTGDGAHIIWNPYQVEAAKPLKADLRLVSDHFPVTLDIV